MKAQSNSMRKLVQLSGAIAALSFLVVTPVLSEVTFKIATIAPEGSDWMRKMRASASEISELTEGRVRIKYYGGGVMGNDKKVLRKMRIGQLQGGAFASSGLMDRYPEIGIYGLPLLFENDDEADFVRESVDPRLAEGLESAGLKSFGFASGGFALLMANHPVNARSDLVGRKIWVPEGDRLSFEAMQAMDLSPVVLPITDVLTGLQTGLLDVVATPPVGALVLQWHTKVRFVTSLPVSYTLALMAIDKRAYGRISDADKLVFESVMTRTYADFDAGNRSDNQQARQALEANGIRFVTPSGTVLDRWRELAANAQQALRQQNLFEAALLDETLALVSQYRQTISAAPAGQVAN